MGVQVAKFIDLREGVTANQFTIGDREKIDSISDLDPMYKRLMDEPIACVMAVMGGIGRPNLTPMWFDYEGDKVLVNVAEHRKKTKWIKDNPQNSIMIVNPKEMYHWLSLKVTVETATHEDDEGGEKVINQLNKIAKKYLGVEEYPLRDPSFPEKRILFECKVDNVATFGTFDWNNW